MARYETGCGYEIGKGVEVSMSPPKRGAQNRQDAAMQYLEAFELGTLIANFKLLWRPPAC